MSQIKEDYGTVSSELERLRAKARHDEAQALYHAEQEGRQKGISERNLEIARNLLKMGMTPDQVSQATGLTPNDLRHLDT